MCMYLYCKIFFCAYKSRLRRKRFSEHVHVCVLAFSPTRPIAKNVHCTVYGDIYVQYYMSCAERTKNNPDRDLSSSRYIVCCRPSVRDGGLTGGRAGAFGGLYTLPTMLVLHIILQLPRSIFVCAILFSFQTHIRFEKFCFPPPPVSSALIKRRTESANVFIIPSNKSYPVALRPFSGSPYMCL